MKLPAIIFARGGSKRLLRKNVLPFCGLPLVAWSLIQANCSHLITDTYLSTDDDEIEAIGREYGAKIIRRPDWPNPDELGVWPVAAHAILEIEKQIDFEAFILLLPTAPVRKPDDLDRGIDLFKSSGKIWAISCYNPRELDLFKKQDDYHCSRILFDKHYRFLLSTATGTVYNKKIFLKININKPETDKEVDADYESGGSQNERWTAASHYYFVEWFQQWDIDDKNDFELCEIMMERYILKGRGKEVYEEYAKGAKNNG